MIIYWVWSLPLYLRPRSLFCEIPRRLRKSAGVHGHRGVVPKIFICLHSTSSLVRLISSNGRASRSSAFPAAHSSLSTLPRTTVEVYRVTPYLPPSYVGMVSTDPRIISSTTHSNPRRGVVKRFTRLHRPAHKHGLFTPVPSSQPRRLSYFRLSSGYSRSPELDVYSLPRVHCQVHAPTDREDRLALSRLHLPLTPMRSSTCSMSWCICIWMYFTSYLHQCGVRTFSPGSPPRN